MALTPRDYQAEGLNYLWDYFVTHPVGNPVVAMPTGTGKAFSIALFVQKAFHSYNQQKMLIVTHVKELIDQNYKEFLELWPTAPAGVYSAGLKRKDTAQKVIFCGVASINKNIAAFGRVDIVIVDECHLISQADESMYHKVFAALRVVNPQLRIIGFTATPWRAGQGKITDDGIFTDICFDVTNMHAFNRFIKEGYLAPLIPKQTQTVLDVSGVHMRGGDFNESELHMAVAKDHITFAALQEAVVMGEDRHSWLVFGAGIAHVEKITEMLNHLGVTARCVHSKMGEGERDRNIKDWKEGKFVAMVNNGVLTTGLNHKPIDFIIMLRPTQSTVLWVQMLGRGTRPYDYLTEPKKSLREAFPYTKPNCLVADFAGNTRRLGPINDPVLPRKRGAPTGEVPIKICEGCGMYNHISARYCGGEPFKTNEGCGMAFIFKTLIKEQASTEVLVKGVEEPIVVDFHVDTITFNVHKKIGKPDSLKVTYWCGIQKISEYVLFEHEGFGRRMAVKWWTERSVLPCPTNTADAVLIVDTLLVPTDIRVWINQPYPKIMDTSFTGAFQKKIIGDDVPF